MICLSLTGKTLKENREQIERFRSRIALAELRADFLDTGELSHLSRFPGMTDLPVILSLRKPSDGGFWSGTESDRLAVLARSVNGGFSYADLEDDLPPQSWEAAWTASGGKIIRSFHDFNGVPGDLEARMRALPRRAGEIAKAAVTPNDTAGLLRLLEACSRLGNQPRILLGMGPVGVPTRILAQRLGSLLTFASAPGTSAAPGHMDPDTLEDVYGYSRMGKNTRLFGIIGNPVMHTRSPHIHNRGFRRLNLDCAYIPFQVDDPEAFLTWALEFGFEGFSVTVPHKEAVLNLLSKTHPPVKEIGSCNTLVRSAQGDWEGFNTDAPGFAAPLEKIWGAHGFAGRQALVLGAGGASRAVLWELIRRGVKVTLANRSAEKAKRLAGNFGIPWQLSGDGSRLGPADLVVQTTPAGMHPLEEEDPVPAYPFSGKELVYDLIYSPPETVFLKRAREAGCRTVSGMEMLTAQGHAQFRLFSGRDYPEAAGD